MSITKCFTCCYELGCVVRPAILNLVTGRTKLLKCSGVCFSRFADRREAIAPSCVAIHNAQNIVSPPHSLIARMEFQMFRDNGAAKSGRQSKLHRGWVFTFALAVLLANSFRPNASFAPWVFGKMHKIVRWGRWCRGHQLIKAIVQGVNKG